jgi:hypoxanthine-DNA glycosylase
VKAPVDRTIAPAPAKRSFPPIVDARARILVLGTLPGEESLRRREYYAHPRNLFWPIVFGLFGATPTRDYAERLAFVMAQGIALWDVCELGEREASADSAIRRERPNAIDRLSASADPRRRIQRHHGAAPLRPPLRTPRRPRLSGTAFDEPGACSAGLCSQARALDGPT